MYFCTSKASKLSTNTVVHEGVLQRKEEEDSRRMRKEEEDSRRMRKEEEDSRRMSPSTISSYKTTCVCRLQGVC